MAENMNALVAALPHFSGDQSEDIRSFIRKISDVCNIQAWPDENRIILLRMHCRGKADDFLMNDPVASTEEDFGTLCNLLIRKFQKHSSFQEASKNFSQIVQRPKQSVRELAEEVTRAGHKFIANETNNAEMERLKEELMHNRFLEALRSDLRVEVAKMGTRNFNEAVEKAINVERALDQQAFSVNSLQVNTSQNLEIQVLLKQQLENNKQIAELTSTIKKLTEQNQNTTPAKPICDICHKFHQTKECWHFSPQIPSSSFSAPGQFAQQNRNFEFREYPQQSEKFVRRENSYDRRENAPRPYRRFDRFRRGDRGGNSRPFHPSRNYRRHLN